MTEISERFQLYAAWRDGLANAVDRLRGWLSDVHLLEPDSARRLETAIERLADDKLLVAFVAEFSRGKSELINSIFFADYGRRLLPSSAGRTTMCPTELTYDETLPPCVRALPIETRARVGSTTDFKRVDTEWRIFPLDTASSSGMLEAFRVVAETVRVSVDEARMYALFDGDDPAQMLSVDEQGTVEISRWRHVIINFPHPLLRQGLVVLDTPGLNAIGTEPELTLSLVPSAHAMLFVLTADAGVTKSDLEIWNQVVGDAGSASHLVVLNKIDGMWDPLRSEAEIDAEVAGQVADVAAMLKVPPERVFAVSAQKGLVAKITGDSKLLERSRLPRLEAALVDSLLPSKQRIVRDRTLVVVDRVVAEVRSALAGRERGLIERLYELRALQGKNQSAVERMHGRAQLEQREFETVVRKVVAMRAVLRKISEEALGDLQIDSLRRRVIQAREGLKKSRLTMQFFTTIGEYFDSLRTTIRGVNARLDEIEKMVDAMQKTFAAEHGWSLPPPMHYSLNNYLAEIDGVEAAYRKQFSGLAAATSTKWTMIERFFETAVSRSREVFNAAERDVEAWLRSLLPPLEVQLREERSSLAKRTDAVARIRDAQGTLDERIGDLEDSLQEVHARLDELSRITARIQRRGHDLDRAGEAASAAAQGVRSSARIDTRNERGAVTAAAPVAPKAMPKPAAQGQVMKPEPQAVAEGKALKTERRPGPLAPPPKPERQGAQVAAPVVPPRASAAARPPAAPAQRGHALPGLAAAASRAAAVPDPRAAPPHRFTLAAVAAQLERPEAGARPSVPRTGISSTAGPASPAAAAPVQLRRAAQIAGAPAAEKAPEETREEDLPAYLRIDI